MDVGNTRRRRADEAQSTWGRHLAEVLVHFRECPPRGEIVLTVAGADRVRNTVHRNKYRSGDEGEEGSGGEE